MAQFRVVDIGSKIGGSAGKYGLNVHKTLFKGAKPKPSEILCIERQAHYAPKLRQHGFSVLMADAFDLSYEAALPPADVYLASNMLEHCPCVDASMHLLEHMMRAATQGVWLRLPTFEQDDTGEGRLRKHGLRLNWTSWRGHYSHFCLSHVDEALRFLKHQRPMTLHVQPGRVLHDSNYPNVLPDIDDEDLINYDPKLYGPRPYVKFKPPIIGEWDVQILWS